MKTGDTVKHIPSGETLIVGWADDTTVYPIWSGDVSWPVVAFELVKQCTQDESNSLMKIITNGKGDKVYHRRCADQLARLNMIERRAVDRRSAGDRRIPKP